MDGYLKRIVTRGAALQNVVPLVRSASPVASEDQRIGLPGFEDLASLDAAPVPEVAGTVPPAPHSASISVAGTPTMRLQRRASALPDRGASP